MTARLPPPVLASLTGTDDAAVLDVAEEAIRPGTGVATSRLARLTVTTRDAAGHRQVHSVVRKDVRPPGEGRHRSSATDPRHWAYWRRELDAYAAGVLPSGPGLAAPRCHGVVGTSVYLEDVRGSRPDVRRAARRLGGWQAGAAIPDVPWLGGHQLAQRLDASVVDWAGLDADVRVRRLWAKRRELLASIDGLPRVLSHGDFHRDNLIVRGDDVVVLDWSTLGVAPVGADAAHLALSALTDVLDDHLAGLRGRHPERAVRLGYRVTLVLTGASRVHWMMRNGVAIPAGYGDFLWAARPSR